MEEKFRNYIMIMFFYMILSYAVAPTLYYILIDSSLIGAGKGFMIGSVASIVLWLVYGSMLV
jgi:hypothetical protein